MKLIDTKEKKKLLVVGFIITILFSLHYAIPMYVNSTLLSSYFSKEIVGAIYVISGICTLIFASRIGGYIKKYHNYKTALYILAIDFIFTLLIGFSHNPYVIAVSFIINFMMIAGLMISINLFIEEFSDHKEEGMIRGMFLTLLSTGILISPIIASSMLINMGFSGIYLVSAIILIPIAILLQEYYKNVPEPKYQNVSMVRGYKEMMADKNIFGVMSALFILQCFYMVVVIYLPLYIYATTTISITTYLSVIMPFVLIPFVILPYQLGMIADRKLGEKELMIVGLIIIAVALLCIPFIHSSNLFIWGGILLLTRIGAATLETMIYIYFFKKAKKTDAGLVALFGNIGTIATVVVPAFVTVFMCFVPEVKYIFIILALLVLWTLSPVSKIVDTR